MSNKFSEKTILGDFGDLDGDILTNSHLVIVRTFRNHFEADVAKSALDAAGIESMIRADDAGGMRPSMWVGSGVELVVRAEDASRAEQVLGPESS